jgi:hypothetical protein
MKPISLIFLFSTLSLYCNAQQFIERVYLKDSVTVYEGYIIEQAPSKYVKVYRLKEKDTVTVNLPEVWKLTKIYVVDTVSMLPVKKKGPGENKYDRQVFLELLGNGILYSFNYDMRTAKGLRNKWGFRIGAEAMRIRGTDTSNLEKVTVSYFALPFAINYLFGRRKDFLELGIGATYIYATAKGRQITHEPYDIQVLNQEVLSLFGNLNIGYRHVPYKKGISYSAGITPIFGGASLNFWLGFGIGYHF